MSRKYFAAIHQIITTGHWITSEVGKALKEFGISEPQYNVLRVLKMADGEPVTVQQILDNMVQRNSNVTRIVDKLVAVGYASRQECPTNRRKMDIAITEKGVLILTQLDAKVAALHRPMMKNLSDEELEKLQSLIIKLKSSGK